MNSDNNKMLMVVDRHGSCETLIKLSEIEAIRLHYIHDSNGRYNTAVFIMKSGKELSEDVSDKCVENIKAQFAVV
jgi:hypothetical protein